MELSEYKDQGLNNRCYFFEEAIPYLGTPPGSLVSKTITTTVPEALIRILEKWNRCHHNFAKDFPVHAKQSLAGLLGTARKAVIKAKDEEIKAKDEEIETLKRKLAEKNEPDEDAEAA